MLETDKEESWVKARETQTPEHEGPEVGGGAVRMRGGTDARGRYETSLR